MLKWVHYSPLPKNHTTVTSPLKKDEKDRSTNERENEKVYSGLLSRTTKSQTTEENEILECTVKYLGVRNYSKKKKKKRMIKRMIMTNKWHLSFCSFRIIFKCDEIYNNEMLKDSVKLCYINANGTNKKNR